MNAPLIRLNKGDHLVIDGISYEETHRDASTLTVSRVDGKDSRTFTGPELRDLYFAPGSPLKIVRKSPDGFDSRLAETIARPFEAFGAAEQQEMLRRLDYVRACDRFFARKLYRKTPNDGYARLARLVARWRRYVKAKNEGLKVCQVPLEIVSGSTLRDWYMRWRSGGEVLGALAPRTHRKGNRNRKLDPGVLDIIARAVREKWLTLEAPPVSVAHDYACRQVRALNASGIRAPLEEPSEMAVRRWIDSTIEPFEQVFYRKGKKEAEHQFRVTRRAPIASRPLQIVEFDETPLDIILVDANGKPRGRAYLTAGICVATGMIVGWHIGWDRPSWTTVMQALRMAVLPKNTAGSGAESPYPVYGVPEVVKVDNGPAYRSTSLVAASGQLQFELRLVPAGTPHLKGKVERFFLEVTRDFLSVMPGRTFSNVQQRGDYDSESFARFELKDIQRLFMRWVVDIYHNRPNSRAFGQTPLERWQALSGCGVRLPPEAELLTPLIGLVIHRTIVGEGIQYMGLTYASAVLKLLKRKVHMGHEWMVKIDPLDLSQLLILDARKGRWEPIPCKQPELIDGLTLKMWMDVVQSAKARTRQGQRVSRETLLRAREDLMREAEAMGHKPRGKMTARDYEWAEANIDNPEYDISVDPDAPKTNVTPGGRNRRLSAPHDERPASEAGGHGLQDVSLPAEEEAYERAAQDLANEEENAASVDFAAYAARARSERAAEGDTRMPELDTPAPPIQPQIPNDPPPASKGNGLIDENDLQFWTEQDSDEEGIDGDH